MKKLLIASILTFALAGVAYAEADSAAAGPNEQRLSVSEVTKKLEAKGYKVREIEADDGAYEFEATDASGARVEGRAHAVTGEVLDSRSDD